MPSPPAAETATGTTGFCAALVACLAAPLPEATTTARGEEPAGGMRREGVGKGRGGGGGRGGATRGKPPHLPAPLADLARERGGRGGGVREEAVRVVAAIAGCPSEEAVRALLAVPHHGAVKALAAICIGTDGSQRVPLETKGRALRGMERLLARAGPLLETSPIPHACAAAALAVLEECRVPAGRAVQSVSSGLVELVVESAVRCLDRAARFADVSGDATLCLAARALLEQVARGDDWRGGDAATRALRRIFPVNLVSRGGVEGGGVGGGGLFGGGGHDMWTRLEEGARVAGGGDVEIRGGDQETRISEEGEEAGVEALGGGIAFPSFQVLPLEGGLEGGDTERAVRLAGGGHDTRTRHADEDDLRAGGARAGGGEERHAVEGSGSVRVEARGAAREPLYGEPSVTRDEAGAMGVPTLEVGQLRDLVRESPPRFHSALPPPEAFSDPGRGGGVQGGSEVQRQVGSRAEGGEKVREARRAGGLEHASLGGVGNSDVVARDIHAMPLWREGAGGTAQQVREVGKERGDGKVGKEGSGVESLETERLDRKETVPMAPMASVAPTRGDAPEEEEAAACAMQDTIQNATTIHTTTIQDGTTIQRAREDGMRGGMQDASEGASVAALISAGRTLLKGLSEPHVRAVLDACRQGHSGGATVVKEVCAVAIQTAFRGHAARHLLAARAHPDHHMVGALISAGRTLLKGLSEKHVRTVLSACRQGDSGGATVVKEVCALTVQTAVRCHAARKSLAVRQVAALPEGLRDAAAEWDRRKLLGLAAGGGAGGGGISEAESDGEEPSAGGQTVARDFLDMAVESDDEEGVAAHHGGRLEEEEHQDETTLIAFALPLSLSLSFSVFLRRRLHPLPLPISLIGREEGQRGVLARAILLAPGARVFLHRLGEREALDAASGREGGGWAWGAEGGGVWVEEEVLLVAQRLAQAGLGFLERDGPSPEVALDIFPLLPHMFRLDKQHLLADALAALVSPGYALDEEEAGGGVRRQDVRLLAAVRLSKAGPRGDDNGLRVRFRYSRAATLALASASSVQQELAARVAEDAVLGEQAARRIAQGHLAPLLHERSLKFNAVLAPGRGVGARTSFVKRLVKRMARASPALREAGERETEALMGFGVSPLLWRRAYKGDRDQKGAGASGGSSGGVIERWDPRSGEWRAPTPPGERGEMSGP
ncbi:hypothetical protein T484DRAFT_1895322 [Baffinella frigidus]|nr:hypothetical protein T484DRAFT_1895322 [Cryptophyta sp. CCMP2293]